MKRTFSLGRRFRVRNINARPWGRPRPTPRSGDQHLNGCGHSEGVPGGKHIVERGHVVPDCFQRLREWMEDLCIIVNDHYAGRHRNSHRLGWEAGRRGGSSIVLRCHGKVAILKPWAIYA